MVPLWRQKKPPRPAPSIVPIMPPVWATDTFGLSRGSLRGPVCRAIWNNFKTNQKYIRLAYCREAKCGCGPYGSYNFARLAVPFEQQFWHFRLGHPNIFWRHFGAPNDPTSVQGGTKMAHSPRIPRSCKMWLWPTRETQFGKLMLPL